jgi:hypothetical protein
MVKQASQPQIDALSPSLLKKEHTRVSETVVECPCPTTTGKTPRGNGGASSIDIRNATFS